MTEFTYTILSSVSRDEITHYFNQNHSQSDSADKDVFFGDDWKVMLGAPKTKILGHFTISHTPIIFSGSKVTVLHQVELFRLNFLSAGG